MTLGAAGRAYADAVKIELCDDRGAAGFSWIVDEPATRTSHALADEGRIWLVDPVRHDEALERASALGRPAAVVQLLDRHNRDCVTVAAELGIPHLVVPDASPESPFETIALSPELVGEDAKLLADNLVVQIQKFNGRPIGLQFPPLVELTVKDTEPGVRGDTASGGVTKLATLETGLQIRVPLFIKEGEKVRVHTETREFAGRA